MHPREYELCIRLLKIYGFHGIHCAMAFANLHVLGYRKFLEFPYTYDRGVYPRPLTGVAYRYVQVVPGKMIVPGF